MEKTNSCFEYENGLTTRGFLRPAIALAASTVLALTACGNKGDLFRPVDEETRLQLELVEQELDDASEEKKKKK